MTPAEQEAVLRERAAVSDRDRQRQEAEARAREAEARAEEAEAQARKAEAEARQSDGIPMWYVWGAVPRTGRRGRWRPAVAPPNRPAPGRAAGAEVSPVRALRFILAIVAARAGGRAAPRRSTRS